MSVWFLTGASRGLGLEIARQLLERGESVAATARDPRAVAAALPGHGDRLAALALDVTDPRQAAGAVEAALDRFGRNDVLVNHAGPGPLRAGAALRRAPSPTAHGRRWGETRPAVLPVSSPITRTSWSGPPGG